MPKNSPKCHTLHQRVYYEDTDAGGVMYHASYFRFAERARTEMLRSIGYHQHDMRKKEGLFFVVRFIEAEYLKPAFLDDMLVIESGIEKISRTSMIMYQNVQREKETICKIQCVVICVNSKMKPAAITKELSQKMGSFLCSPEKTKQAS